MIISLGEYIKQLKIQKFYVNKFCLNYASGWLKFDCTKYVEALDKEIKFYETKLNQLKEKYKQERFEL